MVLLDLVNSYVNGINKIERMTTIFFAVIILIQVIILLVGLFRNTVGYKAFLRYYGIIPLAFSILCFQHEVGHYIQGTLMLILVVLSVLLSFRK